MKLSIVIATYNEEQFIERVIQKCLALNFHDLEKEVIVVSDAARGRTNEILKRYEDRCKVFYHLVNQGKGAALMTGFKNATGDIVAIQDADLEYAPEDLNALLVPILKGKAEIIYGSRVLQGNPKGSKFYYFGNRFLNWALNILFGSRLTDFLTGTKVFKRTVLKTMHLSEKGFQLEGEFTAQALSRGYEILELPVSFKPRTIEEGKGMRWWFGFGFLRVLMRERFFNWWNERPRYFRILLIAICLSIVLRFVLGLVSVIVGDAATHAFAGKYFAQNFSFPFTRIFWPPPLAHFVFGAAFLIGNIFSEALGNMLLQFVNPLLGSLTIFLVYLLGREIFSSESKAMLAAFFIAILPVHIYYSAIPWTDILLVFFTAAFYLFLFRNKFFGAGVMLGLAMLTKFSAPALMLPGFIYVLSEKSSWREKVLCYAKVIGVASFGFLWNVRNWIYLNNPVYPFFSKYFANRYRGFSAQVDEVIQNSSSLFDPQNYYSYFYSFFDVGKRILEVPFGLSLLLITAGLTSIFFVYAFARVAVAGGKSQDSHFKAKIFTILSHHALFLLLVVPFIYEGWTAREIRPIFPILVSSAVLFGFVFDEWIRLAARRFAKFILIGLLIVFAIAAFSLEIYKVYFVRYSWRLMWEDIETVKRIVPQNDALFVCGWGSMEYYLDRPLEYSEHLAYAGPFLSDSGILNRFKYIAIFNSDPGCKDALAGFGFQGFELLAERPENGFYLYKIEHTE